MKLETSIIFICYTVIIINIIKISRILLAHILKIYLRTRVFFPRGRAAGA
jgi:hypothetical protein